MSVKTKIKEILKQLQKGIYEKEEALGLTLLASLAGESVFLLGPPGVAKSLIARRLKYAYKEGKAFEYLMSHFSTPDEIFGPVSISKLKDQDLYERITEDYLPGATVVFLDEIWKAGPSIQNALLTVLNEKIYRNGQQEVRVSMRALIGASNEPPVKGQGLEALWDRFLVRLPVGGIEDIQNFRSMISGPLNSQEDPVLEVHKIIDDEYNAWSHEIDRILLPDHIFNVLVLIKTAIETYNAQEENVKKQIYISDRRWRKIVRLLRTSAFLNSRKSIDLMDCFLMNHCLWHDPKEIPVISGFVREAIQKFGYIGDFDSLGFREELTELQNEITNATKSIHDTRKTIVKPIDPDYYGIAYDEKHTYYIKQGDFNGLTYQDQSISLYTRLALSSGYLGRNRSAVFKQGAPGFNMVVNGVTSNLETLFKYSHSPRIRKSGDPFSIMIDDKGYNLETLTIGDKRRRLRKPLENLIAAWDKRIARFLDYSTEQKARIEKFKKQDLKHLKTNLFVKPAEAAVIESHIAGAYQEIDKFEVEIREIQHRYHHIQDEEIILQ
ncbi:MAG: AAA family ATPase [Treponema sp.]|jgi:MoxR-like ATPase|nr:AAA family ATPase [Treponema sp.]